MLGNGVAGTLGILVQVAVFLIVTLLGSRSHGLSRGLVYGGVAAVFGYSLVIAFLTLVGIPWQVANVAFTIGVALAAVLAPVRALVADELPHALRVLRSNWAPVAILGGVLFGALVIAALEGEPSIDGQLYHGPVLANIVETGSLWGWLATNQYVFYTDLTMAGGVNLATFAGDARFDNAIQVPHLLLLVFTIAWALGRRFTSTFARVAIGTLIVASPVIWLQPRILYVDLAYGTAVAVVILMIALVREFRALDIVIAGIALSAVFATKPTGILTGLILLVALVAVVAFRRRGTGSYLSTIGFIAAGLGPALVMGTSFYVRNLVQFSNPVYPIAAKYGPINFPGIIDLSIFASGERGNGFVDPARWISYAASIGSGVVNGVTKLDYDPRAGGYGHVPLVIAVIVVALLVMQVVQRRRSNGSGSPILAHWKPQVVMIALAAVILLVQPATFDTRYVIGPTVALLTALLLVDVFPVATGIQVVAGVLAIAFAGGQIIWTERHMFPGLKSAIDVMQGPAEWQANTPAHPGRQGLQVAWMSDDCVAIALQTNGGVTSSGMSEASYLGTLPYGLYGDALCNRVLPITIDDDVDDAAAINGAEYVVLYEDDVRAWKKEYPVLADCLTAVYEIEGSETYPEDETVFRNACV